MLNIRQASDHLGKMIMRMEEENNILRQENTSLNKLYDDSMSKIRNLEAMVLNAESPNYTDPRWPPHDTTKTKTQ